MQVALSQHPVGQGGLMSGLLEIPGGQFHWVYDCGSNQAEALTREILGVAAKGPVDCLFLSHLDSDHVKGVDQLLQNVAVREVVLPYLDDVDRLMIAARDASIGTLSGTTTVLLTDIPAWFEARGVERLTFIRTNNDESDEESRPELPDGDDGFGGEHEGPIKGKWSALGQSLPRKHAGGQQGGRLTDVRLMPSEAVLRLATHYGPALDWLFAPYAHRPSAKKLAAFQDRIDKAFGRKTGSPAFWAYIIADADEREKLRACYDVIWKDHNLVSMALYAGPVDGSAWADHRFYRLRRRRPSRFAQKVAWLGTGDMDLKGDRRRKAFFRHYDHLLDQVNVFGLPHHGAALSFHSTIPSAVPTACQFVAAAGPNSYNHPGGAVIKAVRRAGKQFIRVNDRPYRILSWKHRT